MKVKIVVKIVVAKVDNEIKRWQRMPVAVRVVLVVAAATSLVAVCEQCEMHRVSKP